METAEDTSEQKEDAATGAVKSDSSNNKELGPSDQQKQKETKAADMAGQQAQKDEKKPVQEEEKKEALAEEL